VAAKVVLGLQKAAVQQQTRQQTAARLAEHERQTKDYCVVPAMPVIDPGRRP
jgi:hypothetical protein